MPNIEVIEGELRPVLCTWRVARHPSGKSQSRLTHKFSSPQLRRQFLRRTFETSRPGQFEILIEDGCVPAQRFIDDALMKSGLVDCAPIRRKR